MNNFITRTEYLKQLQIQKYYVLKFSLYYASGWLKKNIDIYIESLDKEIKTYQESIEKSKLRQERFEIL